MTLLHVFVLALIQGLTEFLPVSSSAHLIFPSKLLGWPDQGISFDVAVHVGTLLAVVLYYLADLIKIASFTVEACVKRRVTPIAKIGSGCGSDVLTHHQGNAQIDREYARRTEQDGNRHHRCRTLHDAGDKRTYQQEDHDGEMALRIEGTEEVDNCRIMLQVERLTRTAQQYEREEEKGNTEKEISKIPALLAIYQHNAEEERRENHDG